MGTSQKHCWEHSSGDHEWTESGTRSYGNYFCRLSKESTFQEEINTSELCSFQFRRDNSEIPRMLSKPGMTTGIFDAIVLFTNVAPYGKPMAIPFDWMRRKGSRFLSMHLWILGQFKKHHWSDHWHWRGNAHSLKTRNAHPSSTWAVSGSFHSPFCKLSPHIHVSPCFLL